jgi:hypothetical protein
MSGRVIGLMGDGLLVGRSRMVDVDVDLRKRICTQDSCSPCGSSIQLEGHIEYP